ncbi:hypothetical protein GS398_20535 [Pedobacter sp. HMF7056]|uniref:Altered inheritance of mitochondria protein 6 n=2 Tax=Hufsiella ginkgonis TaxID=2695274 RepID=A0A7K1Y379_9SPHI|nr:hypothetical protein [Hufsiella ginkgonis]
MQLQSLDPVRQQHFFLPNAYSHNDYWNKRPLADALENGFLYVEADIFLLSGQLIVAHVNPFWKKNRTLEELYFAPIARYLATPGCTIDRDHPVTLMIDIKTGAARTYKALLPLLEKYRHILTVCENGRISRNAVTVVLTGNKPTGILSEEVCRLAFIDADLKSIKKRPLNHAISPMASCRYSRLLKWSGKGPIPEAERTRLKLYIQMAHFQGKKVRLWASPENEAVWKELLACGVDLINTDRLVALKNFLVAEQRTLYPGKLYV